MIRLIYRLLIVLVAVAGLGLAAMGAWFPGFAFLLQHGHYRAESRITQVHLAGIPSDLAAVTVKSHIIGVADGTVFYLKLSSVSPDEQQHWQTFPLPKLVVPDPGVTGMEAPILKIAGHQYLTQQQVNDAIPTVVAVDAYWMGSGLVGLAILLLIVGLIRRLLWQETKLRSNTCLHCGHLLIDVDSDECPQCGAVRPLVTVSSVGARG